VSGGWTPCRVALILNYLQTFLANRWGCFHAVDNTKGLWEIGETVADDRAYHCLRKQKKIHGITHSAMVRKSSGM
jgi:hypothetical protein